MSNRRLVLVAFLGFLLGGMVSEWVWRYLIGRDP